MEQILKEIQEERTRQDEQWGGPDHDDNNGPVDWLNYIDRQVALTAEDFTRFRERMVKVAALAVAAIQVHDRMKDAISASDVMPKN